MHEQLRTLYETLQREGGNLSVDPERPAGERARLLSDREQMQVALSADILSTAVAICLVKLLTSYSDKVGDREELGAGDVAALLGTAGPAVYKWVNLGVIRPERRDSGGRRGRPSMKFGILMGFEAATAGCLRRARIPRETIAETVRMIEQWGTAGNETQAGFATTTPAASATN